jgi:hypothetical protein
MTTSVDLKPPFAINRLSANGAVFIPSLGQSPQVLWTTQEPALKARFIESRFQLVFAWVRISGALPQAKAGSAPLAPIGEK